ncbi:hypothetical protein LQ057_02885 [Enterococcus gallinarum]|uniref:hypothetical protein n=1 Tax=Enterococcus gallinarum TaxID=1353 RepID=UPI002019A8D4|nr:hypothetical protein [Enterococcus gallinarum]UQR01283.1 hypothetical protein LQ057_02885 [Enterococcus gallinarum]
MIKGKTNSGFKYSIEKKRLDNYELLEVINEVDENPTLIPKALKLLLGQEQANALKEHVRDEDGIVPAEKMIEELGNIFQNQAQTKNS